MESIPVGFKWCARCKSVKPLDSFYRDSGRKDGRYPRCKACCSAHQSEQRKAYYQANKETINAACRAYYAANKEARTEAATQFHREHPEVNRAATKKWRANNPDKVADFSRTRRARILGSVGTHTTEDILQMVRDQHGLCAYCECQLEGGYEVDHMVPLSRGGSDSWENLAIACPPCNRSKNAKTVEEFIAKRREEVVLL